MRPIVTLIAGLCTIIGLSFGGGFLVAALEDGDAAMAATASLVLAVGCCAGAVWVYAESGVDLS